MKKYDEGHFVGMGMAIGAGVGIPLGLVLGGAAFLGIGIAVGVTLGLAIGKGVENKYMEKGLIKPLSAGDKKKKRMSVLMGLVALGLLVILFLTKYLSR